MLSLGYILVQSCMEMKLRILLRGFDEFNSRVSFEKLFVHLSHDSMCGEGTEGIKII